MTPRRGGYPLLLFSLVGLLVTCAQEPDTAGQNTTGGWKGRPCPASPGEGRRKASSPPKQAGHSPASSRAGVVVDGGGFHGAPG